MYSTEHYGLSYGKCSRRSYYPSSVGCVHVSVYLYLTDPRIFFLHFYKGIEKVEINISHKCSHFTLSHNKYLLPLVCPALSLGFHATDSIK